MQGAVNLQGLFHPPVSKEANDVLKICAHLDRGYTKSNSTKLSPSDKKMKVFSLKFV